MIKRSILVLATMLATVTVSYAQYPTRPVKIVMPAAPGGGTDIHGRYMAARLSERLGQQFYIENVPAAGGNVAAAQVAKAEPDGYTLLMIAPATAINHSLYAKPGFDAIKDFVQIAGWAQSPLLFVVNPDFPVKSLKELTDTAKANPGKFSFGNGPGFINHMVMELYKIEAGVNIQFVPYRGMAPVMVDLISGVIPVTVDSTASSRQHVESGKVRALAITSAERSPLFPNVPTVTEAGYPTLTGGTWYGVLGPAKMPADIVKKLSDEIVAIQAEAVSIKRIQDMGADPFVANAAAFTKFYQAEVDKWANVVKATGLKID